MMTVEVALWIVSILTVPAIGWAITTSVMLMKLLRDSKRLVTMHEEPAKYGLGPGDYARIVEDNTRAIRSLTHYLKWSIREQTGSLPPPPIDGDTG